MDGINVISEFIVVSNHKFIKHFQEWQGTLHYSVPVTVIDDGTVDNEHRLGAVRDIAFAIEKCNIQEELLVMAGDNLTDFSLKGFVDYFKQKGKSCVMRHYEPDIKRLQRTGVATVDEEDYILQMQEKPEKPLSCWAVPPFYAYTGEDLQKVKQAVEEQMCNVDAPGDFLSWLCEQSKVYAYQMPGQRYDIGTLESYYAIQEEVSKWESR